MTKKVKRLNHLEPFLKDRVKDLVFVQNKYPDEALLVSDLQSAYPEYRRKKANVLKIQIRQCLDELSHEHSDEEESGEEAVTDQKFIIDKEPSTNLMNLNELYKRASDFNQLNLTDKSSNETKSMSRFNQNDNLNSIVNSTLNATVNSTLNATTDSTLNVDLNNTTINNTTMNSTNLNQSTAKSKKIKKRPLNDRDESDEIDKLLNKRLKAKNKYIKDARFKLSDFVGIDNEIRELKKFVNHFHAKESFYPKDHKCVLIHGPAGVGKTSLVEAIANHLNVVFLSAKLNLINGEKVLKELIELTKLSETDEGCLILIDNLESIGQKTEDASSEKLRCIEQFKDFLDSIPEFKERRIIVFATTNKFEKLDAEFKRLFKLKIKLNFPDKKARHSILKQFCSEFSNSEQLNLDLDSLSKRTVGYVAEDYHDLFKIAKSNANERIQALSSITSSSIQDELMEQDDCSPYSNGICQQDIEEALMKHTPISKSEGFVIQSEVTLNDIGALTEAKNLLESSILSIVKYSELAKSLRLDKPTGILMYGPPGCGKTLLAKAIASEAEINLISVRGPDLLNKYVGESERLVRELFERANALSPCLIFFDEFDSLSSTKQDSDNNVTSRVIKQLLTVMDGFESRSCFMLAATNRPDLIDPALLRPGRFDESIYIGVPNAEERVDILRTITKDGQSPKCSPDVDFHRIGINSALNGFSGADLNQLVTKAARSAFGRFIKTEDRNDGIIRNEDFELAAQSIDPSLNDEQIKFYEDYKTKFKNRKK